MKTIEVKTANKTFKGLEEEGIYKFLGLPYALPPVNERRFKRAVPDSRIGDIVDCTIFKNKAPQPKAGVLNIENDIVQSEDCLYLNVWTTKELDKKKPVVVWIHGGAFMTGETGVKIYDGKNFAVNGDVVFVSIQYRLGIFGFMDFSYLNDDGLQFDTNVGLSDQIEALKWVKANINYFGGDEKNITLMGESAGATSILSLIASPKAKGLFHRAICQSAIVDSLLSKKNARFWAKNAMELMGLEIDDAIGLKQIQVEVALQATSKINETFTDKLPGSWPFGPVIDGDLLPMSIIESFKNNQAMSIPLLLGTNKDEAANFIRDKAPWLPSNQKQINRMFRLNPKLNQELILGSYSSYPNTDALREIGRDMSFVKGNTKVADMNSVFQPTYVYRFDYQTVVTKKMNIGAFHGMEIMFAFNNLNCELSKILTYDGENPQKIADMMHRYWLNFIKWGNPNGIGLVEWKLYTKSNRETIVLDLTTKIVNNPDQKGYEIWKDSALY
jgi:para-nitrobenzyl esterase